MTENCYFHATTNSIKIIGIDLFFIYLLNLVKCICELQCVTTDATISPSKHQPEIHSKSDLTNPTVPW